MDKTHRLKIHLKWVFSDLVIFQSWILALVGGACECVWRLLLVWGDEQAPSLSWESLGSAHRVPWLHAGEAWAEAGGFLCSERP